MKVGIVGIGVIGNATKEVLEKVHEVFPYDKYKRPYSSNGYLEKMVEK